MKPINCRSRLLERASLSSPASRLNNQQPTNQTERMKNPQSTSQTLTCPALHLPFAGNLLGLLPVMTFCLALLLLAAGTAMAQTEIYDTSLAPTGILEMDQADYQPGATANISGSGFQSFEAVTLQVLHADGTPAIGDDHQPWTVNADADGNIASSWHVCEDDCVGSLLEIIGIGATSARTGWALFSDASLPNGGFETGSLSSWASANSGNGFWSAYTGSNPAGFSLPSPPQGNWAAFTQQGGPGSHVLYQDLVLAPANQHTLTFMRTTTTELGYFTHRQA